MLTWKSKERDLQNAVLESHIYSLFTDNSFDISEEKICVFDFHCCLQEVMEELSGNCLVLRGEQVLESATGHTNPALQRVYSGCLLFVCLSVVCFVIDNQVYKVYLKRNCKPIHWHCIQPIYTQWFVGKREWVNGGIT